MSRAIRGSLLATLLGVACATPGQVRRVETRLVMMEVEKARADSTRAADEAATRALVQRLSDAFGAFASSAGTTLDSLKRNDRATADAMDDMYRQLAAIGERVGQTITTQRTLASRVEELNSASTVRTSDTSGAALIPSDQTLYDTGNQKLATQAFAAARGAYQLLLQTYPASPLAAGTLVGIGRTFEDDASLPTAERADSSRRYYNRVITEFPSVKDEKARALFKLAGIENKWGDKSKVKAIYKRIMDECPGTNEARLAKERYDSMP